MFAYFVPKALASGLFSTLTALGTDLHTLRTARRT